MNTKMNTKTKEIVKELRKKKIDVSLLSEESSPCIVTEWISTGCLALDAIMGGGLPVGRIIEIFGDQSTGKSLIAAQVAALAQESGAIVGYADTETAVSLDMMKVVGVDVDNLIYASPDTVEEVFTFFEEAIEIKRRIDPDNFLLLIWDSIAATSDVAEMEAEYGHATMASHARLISQGLRKITRIISRDRACLLLLNQTRDKIGVMFGDKISTFGGKAVKFHSSIRIQLDIGSKIKIGAENTKNGKKGGKIVGIETRAVVVKNKVAMPYKDAILPIYFGHGIDDAGASMKYLQATGAIQNTGSWYTLTLNGKEHKFQKAGWPKFFDENYDDIAEVILAESAGGYVESVAEYDTDGEE